MQHPDAPRFDRGPDLQRPFPSAELDRTAPDNFAWDSYKNVWRPRSPPRFHPSDRMDHRTGRSLSPDGPRQHLPMPEDLEDPHDLSNLKRRKGTDDTDYRPPGQKRVCITLPIRDSH